jgi:hypothetical protein
MLRDKDWRDKPMRKIFGALMAVVFAGLLVAPSWAVERANVNIPVTAAIAYRATMSAAGAIALTGNDDAAPVTGSTTINVKSNFPGTLYFGNSSGTGDNNLTLTGGSGATLAAKASWTGTDFTTASKAQTRGAVVTHNVHVKSNDNLGDIPADNYSGSLTVVLASP